LLRLAVRPLGGRIALRLLSGVIVVRVYQLKEFSRVSLQSRKAPSMHEVMA
jgi:hypothetical protein